MSEKARVELDIFSGMPNPEWTLSDADTATFLAKLAALPTAPPMAPAGNLGYRGFVVTVKRPSDETRVLIQNGMTQATQAGTVTHRADPGRALERWLLETGRPVLASDIRTTVERELPN